MAQLVRWLDYLTTRTSLSPIRRGFTPGFVNYKKGALESQPQVIKFTSCLPMVGGSLRVLRILPQITNPRAQQSCAMRPDMAERACYLICDSVRLHDTMDLSKHVDIKFSTHDLLLE